MGLEEKLPSGLLLTTVEKMGGYARKSSVWPAIFGLARCPTEPFQVGGARQFATARAHVPGVDALVLPATLPATRTPALSPASPLPEGSGMS